MARGGPRDPVEEAAAGGFDLYDVATWEPRTRLDGLAVGVHRWLGRVTRWFVILLALVILLAQFALTGLAALNNLYVGAFILLSVVPALLLAGYVWRTDVTMREPLGLLVGTFLLGVLFAGFAAVLNTLAQGYFRALPVVGMALFFYLVVGPVEETVKWLAVRLHAYRDDRFHAVVDGAVYGAVAGLGFATIENTIYIGQQYVDAVQAGGVGSPVFGAALPTAAVRSFAGPGHVIYSAFAGYYLGLAKFNPEHAGPIAVKGLLIATFVHGTYNTVVTYVTPAARLLGVAIPGLVLFLGFVVLYDGLLLFVLFRKLSRYRAAYRATGAGGAGRGPRRKEAPEDDGRAGAAEPDREAPEPALDDLQEAEPFEWAGGDGRDDP